ncbi:glycosyltransferase family 2 protein [Hoeflea ulvae]|uniref:Glycosyltransferase family 2 protein n=1 Tax=Hoeflea ulvae TaxID=2983764 RepID=A0ABT3YKN4_9HYPH|nr:glycosyltransferase family 2 protein [Hoeflea ulvae]MCY0096393.1 glycosyltransferase family 2 protein [Hoeflea ulvae]
MNGKPHFPRQTAGVLFDDTIPAILEEYARAELDVVTLSRVAPCPGPIMFSVMRDEMEIIADFLEHYRNAGIRKFVILDNNSTDGTFEHLGKQTDIDLYRTGADFTTIRKQAWLNLLLDTYRSPGQWFLCADADEHIVFDGMQDGRDFHRLAAVMDKAGIRRVRGCLVDMYSHHPVANTSFRKGETLIEAYPLFDRTGYREYELPPLIAREGGPRQKLFEDSSTGVQPQLTKYPMFRLEPEDFFVNPHFLWPYDQNFASKCYLGLLHFKFVPHFTSKMDRAISEGNYWENSIEYQISKSALLKQQDLSFIGENTEFYRNPGSLVAYDVIAPIPW